MMWRYYTSSLLPVIGGLLFVILGTLPGFAQRDTHASRQGFWTPASEFAPARFGIVTGGITGLYGVSLIGLNEYWYSQYERTSFHFFDDSREWRGMDKAGHVYSAYFQSRFADGLFKWSGVAENKSALYGGLTSFLIQSSIEVLDGFSAKWGASLHDVSANVAGSALFVAQEWAWQEQRISLKFSAHSVDYPDGLDERAEDLYGSGPPETLLKDYNGNTFWASVNIHSFLAEENSLPRWLNVAVGYGAHNLYGGFENKWCESPEDVDWDHPSCMSVVDRNDIERFGQFYVSPDIDFSRIETNSKFLKTLLTIVNIIKLPAPALEVNTKGNVVFHPLYF